jgi:hypothetical protein
LGTLWLAPTIGRTLWLALTIGEPMFSTPTIESAPWLAIVLRGCLWLAPTIGRSNNFYIFILQRFYLELRVEFNQDWFQSLEVEEIENDIINCMHIDIAFGEFIINKFDYCNDI